MPASPANVAGRAPSATPEPGHLGEPAGDQRGARVVPQPEPFERCRRRSAITFLSAPRQLDADDVVVACRRGTSAWRRACCTACAVASSRGRRDHRGRLPGTPRPRSSGPRAPRSGASGRHSASTSRHERQRVGLDALGGAHDQRAGRHRVARAARSTARTAWLGARRDDQPPRRGRPRAASARRGAADAAARPGRNSGFSCVPVDRLHHLGLVGPEPDASPLPGEQVGQRRAPAAGAEHRDRAHGAARGAARRPNRFSVPLSRRRMLARWSHDDRGRDQRVEPEHRGPVGRLEQVDRQREDGGRRDARRARRSR